MNPINHIAEAGDKMIGEVMPYAGHKSNRSMLESGRALALLRCDDIIKFGDKQVKATFKKVRDYVATFCVEEKAINELKARNNFVK